MLQRCHDTLEEGWSQIAELVGVNLGQEGDQLVVLQAQWGKLQSTQSSRNNKNNKQQSQMAETTHLPSFFSIAVTVSKSLKGAAQCADDQPSTYAYCMKM